MNLTVKNILHISTETILSFLHQMAYQPIDLGALYEPDPVAFSFQTVGWYILFVLLIMLGIYLFYKWFRNYQKNAYRREAIKTLENLQVGTSLEQDKVHINELFILLKSVAIFAFGREKVSALSGNFWLQFLESTGDNTPFTDYSDEIFRSIYENRSVSVEETNKIIVLTKKWIRTHA